MRLRKKPWAVPALEASPIGITEPKQYKGKWQPFFKKAAPLHVELGTGKGKFITSHARLFPEINYLGIEMKPEALVQGIFRAEDIIDQGNLGLILMNINHILDIFAVNEVDRLFINFCDPWSKKAHAKRRLTHHNFLMKYRQFLAPGAEIHFKTDNRELFEFSLNEFANHGFRLKNMSLDLHHSDFTGNIMTEYEEKFSSLGMPIYRLEACLNKLDE